MTAPHRVLLAVALLAASGQVRPATLHDLDVGRALETARSFAHGANAVVLAVRSFDSGELPTSRPDAQQLTQLESSAVGSIYAHAAAAASGLTASSEPVATAHPPPNLSADEEVKAGRALTAQVLGSTRLVEDAALQLYINRVGRWIADRSARADLDWRFAVIDSRAFNAYAAPAGYVLITRALYDELENEAQLAAVLGHAIAVVAQHMSLRLARSTAAAAVLARLAPTLGVGRAAGRFEHIAGQAGAFLESNLSRNAVYEADRAGAVLAARAGYSPDAILAVLRKLQALRSGNARASPLSTHPLPSERAEKLQESVTAIETSKGAAPPIRRGGASAARQ
ncbi:MAG TPA: M48 family metalloprotease [Burkholderiales bacterium]|nr:M48 family metalloprotease [Burkholderiales bacterium]